MSFEQSTLLCVPSAATVPPVAGGTIAGGVRTLYAAHPLSEVAYGARAGRHRHVHAAMGAIVSHCVALLSLGVAEGLRRKRALKKPDGDREREACEMASPNLL